MRHNPKRKKRVIIGACLISLVVGLGVIVKIRYDLAQEVGQGGYHLLMFALKRFDNE